MGATVVSKALTQNSSNICEHHLSQLPCVHMRASRQVLECVNQITAATLCIITQQPWFQWMIPFICLIQLQGTRPLCLYLITHTCTHAHTHVHIHTLNTRSCTYAYTKITHPQRTHSPTCALRASAWSTKSFGTTSWWCALSSLGVTTLNLLRLRLLPLPASRAL
jgi:hypothetical protein